MKFEIAIHGDENLKPGLHHQIQDFPIPPTRPIEIPDVRGFVTDKVPLERAWHTLIKQQPHWPP